MCAFSARRWILSGVLILVSTCNLTVVRADETPDLGDCPLSRNAPSETFHRLHQIPIKDKRNLPMVTPGGMILELPKMVAATDVLTINGRDDASFRFQLVTFGRNRHRCVLLGTARRESTQTYLFRDEAGTVRFTLVEPDQIRVEPLELGDRRHCQAFGEIERAIYIRVAGE